LEEAVSWFVRELQAHPGDRGHRYWLAHAYYGLERWPEAEDVLRELVADFPDRGNYKDFWALAIARTTGSRDAAMSVVDVADPGSHEGSHHAYRARLEAVLGDDDRALSHLSEAFQRGVDDMSWLHSRAFRDFAPLEDDARFVRLVRPAEPRAAAR
jgi:tetratricopeptide (TPR) repeat protein